MSAFYYLFSVLYQTVVAVLIIVLFKYNWDRRKLYALSWRCNGPLAIPFGGNLLAFSCPSKDILPKFDSIYSNYKDPVRLWMGPELVICMQNLEDCEIMLNNPLCLEKADAYRKVAHEGLFSSPLAKWKRHRKLLQPCFNPRFLNSFVEVFNAQSATCVKELEKIVDVKDYDLKRRIFLCFIDMLIETELGIPMSSQTRSEKIVENFDRGSKLFLMRVRNLWYHLDLTFSLIGAARECAEIKEETIEICSEIINEKKRVMELQKNESFSDDSALESHNSRKALLDHMIEISDNGRVFSQTEIVDHLAIFIMGGTDTGTVSVCSTLMLLSMYQDVQEKVMDELREIFGNSDRPVTCDDLKNLKYLERVIKEAMRLFPVTPLLGRKTTGEVKLSNVTVPQDTSLVIYLVDLHRNPKYWPDPLRFDPDRFLPEEVAKRNQYSYLPFSAGPRNCIGLVYGMMAMKVVVTNILRTYKVTNFKYKSVEDIKLDWQFVVTPVDDYGVLFHNRAKNLDQMVR